MARPFRPHSRSFRTVLAMALLAWAALASGALAGPSYTQGAMGMDATMPMAQTQAAATHCAGMPVERGATHHTPATPMGHGDCCHGGCNCLSVCNVVLTVPALLAVESAPQASLPTLASIDPVQMPVAPLLRPPIA